MLLVGGIHIDGNAGVCTDSTLDNTIYRNSIIVETQVQVNALNDTLSRKTIIDGNLTIGYTDSRLSNIDSLSPLSHITHITGNLIIQQNGQLVDLSGFNNLRTIGGYFSVTHNNSLTFLGDFSALTSIGTNNAGKSIVVENNSLLAYCCALKEFRSGGTHQVSGSVDISNNAMGCSSDSEVNCDPFVHLSKGNILDTLPDTSSNVDFTLSSDGRWQLRQLDTDSWVTLSVDSGGANDTLTHTFVRVEHLRNESYNARMVKFSIDLPDETSSYTPDTLTIIQEKNQTPKIELTSHTAGDTIKIAYDNTDTITLNFTIDGSATGWEANINQTDGFIHSPLEGTNEQTSITLTPSSSKPSTPRKATITLSTTGQIGNSVSVSLTITQEAVPTIHLDSYNDGGDPLSLGSDGTDIIKIAHDNTDTITIDFTVGGSAKGWTDSIIYTPDNVDFIMLQRQENKNDGTRVIKIIPSANEDTILRKATITLSTTGQIGNSVSVSLTITQEAIPVLEITSNDAIIIHDATDSIPIKFYVGGSATGWESMNDNFNFVTLPLESGTDTGNITIMASPMKNMGVERTDTIILSTKGNGVSVSDTFTITQKAAPRITLTSLNDTIAHDATDSIPIKFFVGGSATGWKSEISYMPDTANFITLSLDSGMAQPGEDITIMARPSANKNTTPVSRKAIIKLITTGPGETPNSDSLTITQEARPTIMLTSHSDGETITIAHDDPKSITLDFLIGGSATNLMSTIRYIPEGENFIDLLEQDDKGDTMFIKVSPNSSNRSNEDTASRTATITLSTAEHLGTADSVSLTIRQEGKPALDIISNHKDTIAYDATESIPIKFFIGGSATGWTSKITGNSFITLSTKKDTAQTDTITIMASPMENMGNERIATIRLSTTGQIGDSASAVFTITQETFPTIEVRSIDGGTSSLDSISIAYDATDSIPITFNVGGSAKGWESKITYEGTDSGFVTLSTKKDTAETGVITITAKPMKNMGDERTDTITLSTTGQIGTPKSVSLTITQEAIPVLEITSNDAIIIHDATDLIPINFFVGGSAKGWESDISYTGTTSNFITLSPKDSIAQTGTIIIIANPMENMNVEERTAMITLSTMGNGVSVSDIFTITQKAAPRITLTSPGDTSISIPHHDIMPRTITFNVGGSATGWKSEISYMPDTANFITLKTPNDSTSAIEITPSVNENTIARTATITLRTMGEGTPNRVSLTITQEAMPTIMLSSYIYNNDTSVLESNGVIDIAHDHNTSVPIPIEFIFGGSATGWKSKITGDPFISLASDSGSNKNTTISIIDENTTTTPRTATITLSTKGQKGTADSVSLTIRQEGKPALDIISNHKDTIAYDATESIPIKFFIGGSATGWTSKITGNSFITLSTKKDTAQTDTITIMASPMENMGNERIATIRLSTTGQIGDSASAVFTITQETFPTIEVTSINEDISSLDSISIAHDDTDSIRIKFDVEGSAKGWESKITYEGTDSGFVTLSTKKDTAETGVITITAKPMKNMGDERTDTITLSTTGQIGTPKSVSLTITQEAIPVLEITSNDAIIIHDATDLIPINFFVGGSAKGWESDISYTGTTSNFITLSPKDSIAQTGTIIIIANPMENMNVEERTAMITLSTMGNGVSVSDIFTITQKAAPRITLTSPGDTSISIPHHDIMPRTITFNVGGSATGWKSEISYMPDTANFITLKTPNDSTSAIEITPSVNENTIARTATITLRTMGEGTPNRVSLTITQEAMPTIMLSSYIYNNDTSVLESNGVIDIAHDHNTSVPIPIEFIFGGSATGWKSKITGDPFISLASDSGSNKNTTISIIDENTTTTPRTATITLSTKGQKGTADSVSLTIRQEGKPALDIISNHKDTIAYDATESIPIKFFIGGSATGWTSKITGNSFITLSTKKDTAQTDTITIMASPMENMGNERIATIRLSTTGQIGDSASAVFTITQETFPTIEVTSINEDISSLDSISIAHDDTDSIRIKFDVEGSAKGWESKITYEGTDSGFITLSTKKDTTETGVITITAKPMKNMGDERTDAITLSTTGQIGTPKSVSLTITQEAIPVLQITFNDTTIIHDATDSIPIKFYVGGSAKGWTSMDSNLDFVTLPLESGTDTGNITIMARPSANTDTTSRTATIILSTTGHIDGGASVSDTFTITQKAAPRIILTSHSDDGNIPIAHDDTLPRTISFTLKGNFTGWESSIIDTENFITLNTPNDSTSAIEITPSVNENTIARTATITLRTMGEGTPDSVSLTITQEARPTIMLTDYKDGETITIAHDAPKSITLNFLIGGSATDLMSAISYIPKGANFISTLIPTTNDNNDTISIKISPDTDNLSNTDTASRTATITLITAEHLGTPDSVSLTIRQEASPTIMLTSPKDKETISIAYDDTDSIPITFNVGGSAKGWESEITGNPFISLSSNNGTGQPGDNITIMAIPMKNTDINEHIATITLITTGQKGEPTSVSLTITQKAAPTIKLTTNDTSVARDATDPISIKFFVGGSAEGWTSHIDYMPDTADFIMLNSSQNDTKGSIPITATPSANEDTIPRTATIKLSTTGHDGDAVSVSLIITQEAKPVLKLTSNDAAAIAHDAIDSIPITFYVGGSATGWESKIAYTPSDVDFVTLSSEESMDQTGPITIMASPSSNTDLKKRTATIILSTKGKGVSVEDILTITQAAAPEIKLTSHTNGANIDIAHHNILPKKISFTLKGSAEGWTDTIIYTPENANFITPPQTTGEEGETISIQITPSANEDTIPRTATITLKTTRHEGTPDSVSLTITQEAMPVIELISKETDTIIHDATDSIPINFILGGSATGWESNILYTPRDADFVTLSPKDSITQTGDITIMASPTENTDNEERMATIRLSTTGQIRDSANAVFTIIQKAKPTIILTSHTDGDTTFIAYNDNIRKSIEFTVSGSANGWTSHIDYMPDSANFITLNLQKNDDTTGNITIRATPSANTSAKRTATIILITAGHEGTPDSVSLTITQGGAEPSLGVAPSKPFTLYPNPTNGTLTIEGVTGYLQMYIYDLVGREVMTYSLTPSKKTIDVSDLPSGMYVVTLRGENKTWKEVLMKK